MHSLSFPLLITSPLTSRHILQFRRAPLYICLSVCVYELWVGWEQEVTHSGIPQALGFDLLARAVQECGSSLKHHLETKSWQTTLVPQSRWNCNGSLFYHKLRYQNQLQYLNSCCTGFPFSLVHWPRLALSFKHRQLPAWVPVENTPIWPSVFSYELLLIYLFQSSVQLLGNECRRMETQLRYVISASVPSRALEGAFHTFPVKKKKVQEQNFKNLFWSLALLNNFTADMISELLWLFDLRHTCTFFFFFFCGEPTRWIH